MNGVLNLAVLIIIGTMLADLIANKDGTTALFNGVGGLWKVGINGVLGKSS